jgi:hypothetical protein
MPINRGILGMDLRLDGRLVVLYSDRRLVVLYSDRRLVVLYSG